jgi:hypothetical protein
MSEYTAFFRNNDDSSGRTYAQYFGTADEAWEHAKVEYPDLELLAIHEGPSIEIRLQQIEEYGRVFSNDEQLAEFKKERGLTSNKYFKTSIEEAVTELGKQVANLQSEFKRIVNETA